MARITQKTIRRCRIQFTVHPELHKRYAAYLTRAKALNLNIDFSHDFEEWLKTQLDQIGRELDNVEIEQNSSDKPHSSTIRRES
jgi:hypothetical protein